MPSRVASLSFASARLGKDQIRGIVDRDVVSEVEHVPQQVGHRMALDPEGDEVLDGLVEPRRVQLSPQHLAAQGTGHLEVQQGGRMQLFVGQQGEEAGIGGVTDEGVHHRRRLDDDHEVSRSLRISATVSAGVGPPRRLRRASRSTISALVGRAASLSSSVRR
jgi:hypothetical protein